MTAKDYQIDKTKLAMDWRKSILDRLVALKINCPGSVAQIEIDEAEYHYDEAKLDWEFASSGDAID